MPLQRCGEGGKGWRWGSKGKCYMGPGAKKKAIKQGLAANPEEFSNSRDITDDVLTIVTELYHPGGEEDA